MKKQMVNILSTILVAIILLGCISTNPTPESSSNSPNINVTSANTVLVTSTQRNSTNPRSTSTPYPLVPVNIQPTLSPSNAISTIESFLATNGGCNFPCFWGITPGLTEWKDALETLYPISNEIRYLNFENSQEYMEVILQGSVENYGINPEVYFSIEDGLVTQVDFQTRQSMNEVLEVFGKPEDIWFVFWDYYTISPGYNIFLMYPSQGISIWFFNDVGAQNITINEIDYIEVCPEFMQNVDTDVSLWDPNDLTAYSSIIYDLTEINNPPLVNINESANMDIDAFYSNFLDLNSNECLRMERRR